MRQVDSTSFTCTPLAWYTVKEKEYSSQKNLFFALPLHMCLRGSRLETSEHQLPFASAPVNMAGRDWESEPVFEELSVAVPISGSVAARNSNVPSSTLPVALSSPDLASRDPSLVLEGFDSLNLLATPLIWGRTSNPQDVDLLVCLPVSLVPSSVELLV